MSLSIKSTRDLGFRGEKYAEKLLKKMVTKLFKEITILDLEKLIF